MFGLLVLQSIVQGITEFLPISSQGHLVLIRNAAELFGIDPNGLTANDKLMLDVALHVGTLFAVVLYFWKSVLDVIRGFFDFVRFRKTYNRQLFQFLVVASIPVMIAGFVVATMLAGEWRESAIVVASATLFFGLVLLFADVGSASTRTAKDINMVDALVIGLMQCIALIPGTSRSGITMTGARFMKIERSDAARLSMLLSIPAILAAGSFEGYQLITDGTPEMTRIVIVGAVLSFLSAMVAIWLFMRFVQVSDLLPFVIYRVVLALAIFAFVFIVGQPGS